MPYEAYEIMQADMAAAGYGFNNESAQMKERRSPCGRPATPSLGSLHGSCPRTRLTWMNIPGNAVTYARRSRPIHHFSAQDHQQGTVETSDNSLFLILDAVTERDFDHAGLDGARSVCSAVTHWNLADGDRTMQAFHRNMIELLCLDTDDPEESRRSTVDVTSSPRERTIAANEMEASHQLSNCLPNRGARTARRRALVQDAPTSGARVLLVPADGFSTTTSRLFDARSAQDEVQASPGCVFDGSWAAKAAAPAATV
ncbi:hypothetical protein BD626DRAFT_533721 [Schizophyllum amplum]|uniref:Uncharacterized protein n=1 Tax=Schizophyllum amplum TaxID=97359 RepID=A0A550D0A5_9AGAR|nr:hypothetical protein BD626DRAFT_533721 [Auriculariopsis ampla]